MLITIMVLTITLSLSSILSFWGGVWYSIVRPCASYSAVIFAEQRLRDPPHRHHPQLKLETLAASCWLLVVGCWFLFNLLNILELVVSSLHLLVLLVISD